MKGDFDEIHYFAGYPDKDSMRDKAKRLMLEEMAHTEMTKPGSFSEPGREKMRLYKKGGHVSHKNKKEHCEKGHKHHHMHPEDHHLKHMHDGGVFQAHEHAPTHAYKMKHPHPMHYSAHGHDEHAYEHEPIHEFHDEEARHHRSVRVEDVRRPHGYRHGGKVAHSHHGGKEKKRAHLHKLQKKGLHEVERNISKEMHLSRGGHAVHHMNEHLDHPMRDRHHPETHQHQQFRNEYHPRDIEGGQLTNLHIPTPKLNVESIKGAKMMKRGGHSKHHHSHHHENHEHHKKRVHKAAGGTVYEHEMRGEHPGAPRGRINYEKDMKGVYPAHVPSYTGSKRKNPGACDQSFGSVFKKGGSARKYAAGGAAKVRKGVSDAAGRPVLRKMKMGY